jgi:hypothetical protein
MIAGRCPKVDWKRDTIWMLPGAVARRLQRAIDWHRRMKEEERQNDG